MQFVASTYVLERTGICSNVFGYAYIHINLLETYAAFAALSIAAGSNVILDFSKASITGGVIALGHPADDLHKWRNKLFCNHEMNCTYNNAILLW